MFRLTLAFVLISLSACADETVSGFAEPSTTYRLEQLNGAPFTARANITFPEKGKIAGQAPCNRYFGEQRAVYPWFEVGPLGATRMACPDLEAEGVFLQALQSARQVEINGGVLILSNEAGLEMVFRAE